MNPIAIDFARRSAWSPPRARYWRALLVLGLVLCVAAIGGWQRWLEAQSAQQAQLAALTPRPETPPGEALYQGLSPARAQALTEAIAHLNTPWVSWLAALERHLPAGVTVLQLDLQRAEAPAARSTAGAGESQAELAPDAPAQARIRLRARTVDDMVALLNALQRDPLFAALKVSQQDLAAGPAAVEAADGAAPWVHFTLEGGLTAPSPRSAPAIAPATEPTP